MFFIGSTEDKALKYIQNYVRKNCEINRSNMKNVEIYFTCVIDTHKTQKLIEKLLTKITQLN